ncbi:MAG: DNA methylase N-4/N-6 domain protein [Treponematales bacterium]
MAEFQNTLYTGDNLYVLYGLNSNLADLIYLDPPFNSKRMYSAPVGSRAAGASFKDMWEWKDVDEYYLGKLAINYPALAHYIAGAGAVHSAAMKAYLTYMAQRIIEMHRVLKDSGSLYLHCDPTASHYLKGLLDSVFGRQGGTFRNEIIWCYTGPGSPKMRQFNRKHDTIFWYTKSKEWTFNKDNVRLPYKDPRQSFRKAFDAAGEGWTEEDLKELRAKGKVPETWWSDIAIVARSKRERTGYPTQKPLALLHRIVKASSNEGDIVLDPFCGCATTCVAAQQLGRKWIGIDIEKQPVKILIDRLSDDAGMFKDFIATDKIPVRTDIQAVAPDSKSVKERLYREQNGLCNGCGHEFDIWNLEIDHIVPKSKGGGSYYENYQLLCGACNKKKGDRPMEYLRMQIETRNKLLKQRILFGE